MIPLVIIFLLWTKIFLGSEEKTEDLRKQMEGEAEVFGISGRNALNLEPVVKMFREQMVEIRKEIAEATEERED